MAGPRTRGVAAVVVALAVLALAGCGDGQRIRLGRHSPSIEVTDDPAVLLLEAAEFPLAGWNAEPPIDDDPTVDDETGGVCTLELTDVLTPEQRATERGVMYSSAAQATLIQEYVWVVPSADDVLTTISAQLAACAGPYDGTSGDSTVSMVSEPSSLTMPGASTSVCRNFSALVNGTGPLPGTLCLGARGSLLLAMMRTSFDASVATPEADFVTVMTAATAKAFGG